MGVAAAACRNHPAREAIGVCVVCRIRVCSECATKVDGINHCVDCLAKAARGALARKPAARVREGRVLGAAAGAGLLALLAVLIWALLEVALPG
jgi:hypothetical protein